MMRRGWTLALLGLISFFVLLIATLPARVLLERIPAVQALGTRGSIWSGSAQSLSIKGIAVGETHWRLAALPLLRGRAQADVRIVRADGSATATCAVSLQRKVSCVDLQADVPLEALALHNLPPTTGRLKADLNELVLEQGWPVLARGTVEALDLARPGGTAPSELGSYRVKFPASSSDSDVKALIGTLEDISGPLDVIGTVRLMPDRSYVLDARVAATAAAPRELTQALEYLGPSDTQGRREFSISGTL